MMKRLLIGVAAAGLVGVTGAVAQSSSGQSSTTTTTSPSSQSTTTTSPSSQSTTTTSPSGQSTTTTSPSSQSSTTTGTSDTTSAGQSTSSQTGTTATASAGNELSGEVKKVDKDKQSVKISSPTSGEQELKVGPGAMIMRDGTQASLDQLKEGDQVRASFDPSSKQATKLEVQSKDMKDKQGSSKSDSKSDSKKY